MPTPRTPATRTLGEKDTGRTLAVRVGDKIEVELPSNASTGYEWIVAARGDAKILAGGKGQFIGPIKQPPGSPGKQIWRFDAIKTGKTRLEMHYLRPWEKKPPYQIWRAVIEVR